MAKTPLSAGVVHELPKDVTVALRSEKMLASLWEDLTPLARNEWICWIESAKMIETRNKRIQRTVEDLQRGKRRPCC